MNLDALRAALAALVTGRLVSGALCAWILAALLGSLPGLARAEDAASRCIDRLQAGDRAVRAPVDGLVFECTVLKSGQAVWIGQAGTEHARTVLLVHGLSHRAHRDWRAVVAPLARQFHVVALDLPGFGASEAIGSGYDFEALDGALDEVVATHAHGGRAAVVGHSLGATVALHFAHRHPARAERVVLIGSAGILLMNLYALPSGRLTLEETGVAGVDRVLRRIDSRLNGFGKSLLGRFDTQFDPGLWLRKNPATRKALFGPHVKVDAALGLVAHDFTAAIREMKAPTTLIWGRDDRIAPLRIGRLLAARLPDARLHVIDGAAHVPMTQAPDRFMPLLLGALNEDLPRPPKPKFDPGASQGDVRCDNQLDVEFSGRFDHLTLFNCQGVTIRNARLRQLTLIDSSVALDDVVVAGGDVAIDAFRSQLVATGVSLRARVALRTSGSTLDLAGASIDASELAVEHVRTSWVYFSVSEIRSPQFTGDAHRVWRSEVTGPR